MEANDVKCGIPSFQFYDEDDDDNDVDEKRQPRNSNFEFIVRKLFAKECYITYGNMRFECENFRAFMTFVYGEVGRGGGGQQFGNNTLSMVFDFKLGENFKHSPRNDKSSDHLLYNTVAHSVVQTCIANVT